MNKRKTIVNVLILLGGFALIWLVIGVAFFGSFLLRFNALVGYPVDANEFNKDRQTLTEVLPANSIAPVQLAQFTRTALTINIPSSDFKREIVAVYETENGQKINLSAYLLTDHSGDYVFLSIKTNFGECIVPTPVVNTESNIQYGYIFAGCAPSWYHQFRWLNGDWQLSASASSHDGEADTETLLTFINSYPY